MKLSIIPEERVIQKIFLTRGKKVMFDRDLALLYGVTTGRLNEAVKRNKDRFPDDFMFKLNKEETKIWETYLKSQSAISNSRSQSVTLNSRSSRSQIAILNRGINIKFTPTVFIEQGVAMLSSVLKSKQAVQVNIQIIRTFSKLREILSHNRNFAIKLEEMEKKYDKSIVEIFDILNKLIFEEPKSKKAIGFRI